MVLQSVVTSLVLVCIYVAPVMHIYTGIKYITLYNIIYMCVVSKESLLLRAKDKEFGTQKNADILVNFE